MQDIRVAIEGLTNEIMGLRHENNSLKLECVKLVESSKVERGGQANERYRASGKKVWRYRR